MKKRLFLKRAFRKSVIRVINRVVRMLSPKFDVKQAKEAFRAIVSALNETPLKGRYWLCGGGALGYARCGGFISHDGDIDFHYWREDETEMIQNLARAGFEHVYTLFNNDGTPMVHKFAYKGIGIDFFPCWRENGFIYWTCGISEHVARSARQLLNRVPDQQMKEYEFFGVPVCMPENLDLYLTSLYGDWRTPMPDYCFWIDSKAVVSREPWRNAI